MQQETAASWYAGSSLEGSCCYALTCRTCTPAGAGGLSCVSGVPPLMIASLFTLIMMIYPPLHCLASGMHEVCLSRHAVGQACLRRCWLYYSSSIGAEQGTAYCTEVLAVYAVDIGLAVNVCAASLCIIYGRSCLSLSVQLAANRRRTSRFHRVNSRFTIGYFGSLWSMFKGGLLVQVSSLWVTSMVSSPPCIDEHAARMQCCVRHMHTQHDDDDDDAHSTAASPHHAAGGTSGDLWSCYEPGAGTHQVNACCADLFSNVRVCGFRQQRTARLNSRAWLKP